MPSTVLHASSGSGWHHDGMAMSGWTADDIPSMDGSVAVITGANSGLGLESALALASHGALVVLACRDAERGTRALERVRVVSTGAEPVLVTLDLSDLDSVERSANEISDRFGRIDILMNNAGVMAIPLMRTAQGHEMQFGTNHLGHFALTGRLLPRLLAAPSPRVITTASHAHRVGKMHWDDLDRRSDRYRRWPAYGQSKLANLLFAFELARRSQHAGSHLKSIAAHPGYAATGLQQVGPAMSGRRFSARFMTLGNSIAGQDPSEGTRPQLFAATSPDALSGGYYGPGGKGEVRGAPKAVGSSSAARSREEAHRLWNVSESMTGVHYQWRDDVKRDDLESAKG